MCLINAVKCENQLGVYAISGDIYGHPRFNDGTRLTIQKPKLIDNRIVKLGKYDVSIQYRRK